MILNTEYSIAHNVYMQNKTNGFLCKISTQKRKKPCKKIAKCHSIGIITHDYIAFFVDTVNRRLKELSAYKEYLNY